MLTNPFGFEAALADGQPLIKYQNFKSILCLNQKLYRRFFQASGLGPVRL
jgi:hypothetical protein